MLYFQLPKIIEIDIKLFLINFSLFLSTIPFVAPIPISSDMQYPIFVICAAIILIDFISKNFFLSKLEIYFLGIGIISFVYINPLVQYSYSPFKAVGLLFAFLVYYIFRRYWKLMNPIYFITGVYLNAFIVFLEVIQVEIYLKLVSPFVRLIKMDPNDSFRGLHGLMSEPSFLGGVSAFFFLISYALFYEKRISKISFLYLTITSLALIALSLSITGFIFICAITLLSFFVLKVNKINKFLILLLIIISGTLFFILTLDNESRVVEFVRSIIIKPDLFFDISDMSVATRLMALISAIESILQGHIFGHGFGTMQYISVDLLKKSQNFNNYLGDTSYFAGAFISAISQYIIEIGLLFIIFLFWIYSNTKFNGYVFYIRSISFIYLLFTFSILFPPAWILLAITDKSNVK